MTCENCKKPSNRLTQVGSFSICDKCMGHPPNLSGNTTSENMRKADEAVAKFAAMPPPPTLAEKQATEICRNCRWWIPVPKGVLILNGSLPDPVVIKGRVLGQCSFNPVAVGKLETNFCSHFEQRAEVDKEKAAEPAPLAESSPPISQQEFIHCFVVWLAQRTGSRRPPLSSEIGEMAWKLATDKAAFDKERQAQNRGSE